MDSGSQDNHPLTEGQFITYTCPTGFILSGPNMSVCTGNREWEPDPGQVDCIGDIIIHAQCYRDFWLDITCLLYNYRYCYDNNIVYIFKHAADCGVPTMDRNVMFNNSISTLEGSILTLTCENEKFLNSTNETTLMITVTCHSNRSWIPNPAEFTCSDSSVSTVTVSPGITKNIFIHH